MNGLELIMKQCNLTQTMLEGKDAAQYLGIDNKYLGEINEVERQELLSMPMYRHLYDGHEYYLYRYDPKRAISSSEYHMQERGQILDEEFREIKCDEVLTLERLRQIMERPQRMSVEDDILNIRRGLRTYRLVAEMMENYYSKKAPDRMPAYIKMMDALCRLAKKMGVRNIEI